MFFFLSPSVTLCWKKWWIILRRNCPRGVNDPVQTKWEAWINYCDRVVLACSRPASWPLASQLQEFSKLLAPHISIMVANFHQPLYHPFYRLDQAAKFASKAGHFPTQQISSFQPTQVTGRCLAHGHYLSVLTWGIKLASFQSPALSLCPRVCCCLSLTGLKN